MILPKHAKNETNSAQRQLLFNYIYIQKIYSGYVIFYDVRTPKSVISSVLVIYYLLSFGFVRLILSYELVIGTILSTHPFKRFKTILLHSSNNKSCNLYPPL